MTPREFIEHLDPTLPWRIVNGWVVVRLHGTDHCPLTATFCQESGRHANLNQWEEAGAPFNLGTEGTRALLVAADGHNGSRYYDPILRQALLKRLGLDESSSVTLVGWPTRPRRFYDANVEIEE